MGEVRWSEEAVGGRNDDKPYKKIFLNVKEWTAQAASGQEKGGYGDTNEEKEKLEEQARESAFSVAQLVNVACKSDSVQAALTKFLVVLETSNGTKPNMNLGHEGCGVVAQQEGGVQGQGREDRLCSVRGDNLATVLGPAHHVSSPQGLGEAKCVPP